MNFLPYVLMLVTRQNRAPVDIEWSSTSWTHNVFRLYEKLFWRKAGIRCELSLSAQLQPDGTHLFDIKLHTLEATLSHIEGRVRQSFREAFAYMLTPVPQWQLSRGAIAFGQNVTNGAITPSGSDRMLIAGIFNINNDIGAVSFGGTACNQIDTANLAANRNGYVYMLKAPATSSNSLANVGASNYTLYNYTGVIQNDTVGTIDGRTETTGSSAAPSGTHTAVASGAWTWCAIFVNSQTATTSGFTNMANQTGQGSPSSAQIDSGDTGQASGPETQSLTASDSGAWYVQQTSMAPSASATSVRPTPTLTLLGVG